VADEKPPPEFMNALGTEYFVLQSTASSTISESGSRVSIYLSSLASGLVALGFSSSSPRAFASLAFTVLPTVFVLGWFTIVRLIDTSVANIVSLRRMELIRAYYAALAPLAPPYFGADGAPAGEHGSAAGEHGVRYGRWSFLFTMASMVITVNCVLGGATIALLFDLAFKVPLPAAAGIGVAAGLILLVLSLRYEHRRLTPVVLSSYAATAMAGDSPGVT
jgi:hypothetical protein